MKKLFTFDKRQSLSIIFLNTDVNDVVLESFNDIFEFFNFIYENNFHKKKLKLHCYDPKKAHILIVLYNE